MNACQKMRIFLGHEFDFKRNKFERYDAYVGIPHGFKFIFGCGDLSSVVMIDS